MTDFIPDNNDNDRHVAPAAPVKSRPTVRFLLAHPAHFIALGFGSGMSPVAPGTAGTLWAWMSFLLLQAFLTPVQMGWLIAVSTLVGWWACTVAARNLRIADPGNIVWDEVVAFWLVLWLVTPDSIWMQLAAFVLFRFFDAAKPGPVRWADQAFKGASADDTPSGWAKSGFGILFDDFVAAFCTLLVIAVWKFW